MQRLSTLVVVTLCVVGCGGSAEPAGAGSDAGADLPAASDPTGPTVPVSVTAAALLAKVKECKRKVSNSPYASDVGRVSNIDVCSLTGAVFWKSDLDVDCDGKMTAVCSRSTDPSFQSQTAGTDSKGSPLDASVVPFIVVPGVSSKWNYKDAEIAMGSVVAAVYKGKVAFGIVGDVGPTAIVGEASYAMAARLGINPNPKTGGTSEEVAYIVFTGPSAKVKKLENTAEAATLGGALASRLLREE